MAKIPSGEIFRILSELDGSVGLYITDCKTGENFTINPNKIFPCCSVIKIPMLALLLLDGANGRVDLDAPHPIKAENRVGGTGILCDLDTQYVPTLRDLGKLMIVMSDNTATNEVMDVLHLNRFEEFCHSQGYEHIVWQRKMMDFKAIAEGKNNYMCAGEVGNMLERIANETFVSKEISKTIFSYMCSQKYRNKLPSLIPAIASYSGIVNEIPQGQVLVGNKTGDLVGLQHDVGIFELHDHSRYIISMFTGDLKNDQDGIKAVAEVSAAMFKTRIC
jgi:beta-lactamase class A